MSDDFSQPQPPPPPAGGPMSDSEARNWAMACHLSGLAGYALPVPGVNIIAPMVIWNLKRSEHPLIDDQGKESLNFQISVLIYLAVSALTFCVGIGIVVMPIVALFDIVFVVIAAIKASQGDYYRYPLTIRFVT